MGFIRVFFDNPYFKTRWADGELHKPTIHANVNDSMATEMASPRLAGRTDEGVGPLQEIIVDLPLHLAAEHLWIDLTAIQSQLDAHGVRLTALETLTGSHTTTLSGHTTSINSNTTNITSNTSSIASNTTRLTTIETRIPTPLANFANDAAASAGGIAVGRFYRNGSVVMIRVT